MTKQEIAAIVRKHLDKERIGDITFEVRDDEVITGDDWWRIPVHPSRLPDRMLVYHLLMSDVEQEISEQEGFNILLMSGESLDGERELAAQLTAA